MLELQCSWQQLPSLALSLAPRLLVRTSVRCIVIVQAFTAGNMRQAWNEAALLSYYIIALCLTSSLNPVGMLIEE